jgi:hypothetical protein
MSGQKIVEGLKDAVAGNFSRVTIEGQTWQRIEPPEPSPFGMTLDEMDTTAFFNMRDWLQKAVEGKGAKMVGGGIGLGQADIDIELEGCRYNISIRPLPTHR